MIALAVLAGWILGWILTARYALRVTYRRWPNLPLKGGDLAFALILSSFGWPYVLIIMFVEDPGRTRLRFRRLDEDAIRRFAGLPPKKY